MNKLPAGWTMMKRKGKFAPRNRNGVTFESLGPGLWNGGTHAQAIKAAWDIHRQDLADARRAKEWKVCAD